MGTQIKSAIDRRKLFIIGNLSIFMIGMGFAVRANISTDLKENIYDKIDLANSATLMGEALGITFSGFAFTLLFGSALVDYFGMRRMLLLSALAYILGSLLIVLASIMPVGETVSNLVLVGLLLTGMGWGAVEAASNPMVAALYPEEKTHRLNILHAWWPGGIVIGGVGGVLLRSLDMNWQLNLLLLIVPAIVLIWLIRGTAFPQTERVDSGVSYKDMFLELFRAPLFWLFWICMWATAAAELAPGQWINLALSRIVGMQGILLLVYVSALMFVMRHFAGPIAQRISSIGLLWLSALFAAIGLYLLSLAQTPMMAFLAATVWGIGVCFMWPTMLATTSERFPKGGALMLGMMGFAGGMAIQFLLPVMGKVFDNAKIEAAGGVDRLAELSSVELDSVLTYASVESFQFVAVIPVLLLPIFGFIWWLDNRKKSLAK